MAQSIPGPATVSPFPYADRIRRVDALAPLSWLAAGWRDLRTAPLVSLTYGALFTLIGYILTLGLQAADMLYLVTPLTAGFLLVGPALGIGLYEVSRRLERGATPTLGGALSAWRGNSFHLLTAGLVLMLFMMIWVRIAALIFALVFPFTNMSLSALLTALGSADGLVFLALGTTVGGAFAVVAFVFLVVALPLMVEHRADIFTGALVSAQAVAANGRAMLLWAALIAGLGFLGLFSAFLGLVVVMPLLGHATWHAYRALVVWPAADAQDEASSGPDSAESSVGTR